MSNGSLTGFHHLAFTVRDLGVSTAWYESLFDLETVVDEPGSERRARVYRLRGSTVMLGLVQHAANDGTPFRPERTGLDHAAFAVATRADLDAWVARLDQAEVAHSGAIEIPLGAIVNFRDPDGVQLAIFHEAR